METGTVSTVLSWKQLLLEQDQTVYVWEVRQSLYSFLAAFGSNKSPKFDFVGNQACRLIFLKIHF